MKLSVSLDTQAVLSQPSPAKVKGGGFVPIEVAFTRGTQTVMLPEGASVEFTVKTKNQFTGGTLVHHQSFSPAVDASGAIYAASVNFSTGPLMAALGLADEAPANDIAQIEATAEVSWLSGGQRFRSTSFSLVIEAPLNANGIPNPWEDISIAPPFFRLTAPNGAVFRYTAEASGELLITQEP